MRIAVLADVHGNLPALEAVLDEVDQIGVDRIVLLGDIAGGPMPAQTLDLLASLGDSAMWVHGNGERELVAGFDGEVPAGPAGEVVAACMPLLEQRHVQRDPLLPARSRDFAGRAAAAGSAPMPLSWRADST